MKMKQRLAIPVVVFTLAFVTVISASALGIQHVSMHNGWFSNSIRAGFSESAYGSGSYGTDKSKIVKQCYVRLKEGDYDSGRSYSEVGAKYNGTRYIWSPEESRGNDPFNTCYTYYGWFYY